MSCVLLQGGAVMSVLCTASGWCCNVCSVYCFRVLLRVRLLYYIKQEVIGDEAAKVFQGAKCQ